MRHEASCNTLRSRNERMRCNFELQSIMAQDASLPAFKKFPVRLTEDVRDIATRAKQLPPMLLWVDPNDNDTNSRIERAINCVAHLRLDGESTTLLRCKADKSRAPDVWTRPTYCLQANENVTLLRLNEPQEQDFAFIRTATGVEGFVLAIHLATTKTKATTITRVASTAEALQAIQGGLKPYVSLPPSTFRVMTNNVRVENGERNFNSGSDMARAMRCIVRDLFLLLSLPVFLCSPFSPGIQWPDPRVLL
jgi:hypothetical protein